MSVRQSTSKTLRYNLPILLTFILLAAAPPAAGQGFSTFNGRNHPEHNWQYVESEHFRIMFPQEIQGVEQLAAQIAEETYDALSANLDVSFTNKIRIYLSNEDEITNGFAVPLQAGHTNIWVHINDALSSWTGEEKWMRKVISHELAHIFHYKAIRSNIHPLDFAISEPLPSFWAEGLAQYETEDWDAFRGDRWLRTAVLDDKLSYRDGRSAWNGRLLYSVGNSQLRYFADRFGDSTLTAMLKHRKNALFGLAKVHDFQTAFEETTDLSYEEFYDDWRRHINIYYNSLASQMENADSLNAQPIDLPGQYLYDVQYTRDSTKVAVVALTSLERPVRRLYIQDTRTGDVKIAAEGNIRAPISWSADGQRLVYAQQVRSKHGSLLHDLFLYDIPTDSDIRLTTARRASYPSIRPDGRTVAFAGSDGPTTNVFLLDLVSLEESRLTNYSGDVQVGHISWSPSGEHIAFSLFDQDGKRTIQLIDVSSGKTHSITDHATDNRWPVWSTSGVEIAYTSYRDGVPNVFVTSIASPDTSRRITNLVTGATAHYWEPPSPDFANGRLALIVTESKTSDKAYWVDVNRTPYVKPIDLPPQYSKWTRHSPIRTIPAVVDRPDVVVSEQRKYRPLQNMTHVVSVPFPFYAGNKDWGIGGITSWTEPLSKHSIFAGGIFTIPKPSNSTLYVAYLNNTLAPSIQSEFSYIPLAVRPYENTVLEERVFQTEIKARWPISIGRSPYRFLFLATRGRYLHVEPRNQEDFEDLLTGLPIPESGGQADVRISLTHKFRRPYKYNVVHPLDGNGVRLRILSGIIHAEGTRQFARLDLSAYRIFPAVGLHRILVYARLQTQRGRTLAQNFLGLSRYDGLQVDAPNFVQIEFSNSERVRGYRNFALGQNVVFGSLEYRVPLVKDLQTKILGSVALGSTALTLFADGGLVFDDPVLAEAIKRFGVGVELKNELRLGQSIRLMHAVGIAQPVSDLGESDYDLYYRIRTSLPF